MALGACAVFLAETPSSRAFYSVLVYSLSLVGLFGISALYHRPHWTPKKRAWMRRLDHAAIFMLMAGTGTPICLLAMDASSGKQLLVILWISALAGILQSLFFIRIPKWLSSVFYTLAACVALPFLPELLKGLGPKGLGLLLLGCACYVIGAVVYATKSPNPRPLTFGYHEIFHLLVMLAALFQFILIYRIVLP